MVTEWHQTKDFELQPCPHCRGHGDFVSKADYSGHAFWRVVCDECGCGTWCDEDGYGHEDDPGMRQAAEEWNARA